MNKNLRQAASALLIVVALVVLAVPATAAPRADSFSESTVPDVRVVAELWGWAGTWFGGLPIDSFWAPGGPSMDPDGEPATASGPVPGPGDTQRAGGEELPDPDA